MARKLPAAFKARMGKGKKKGKGKKRGKPAFLRKR